MAYETLIRRIGMNIVEQVEVTMLPEVREHRSDVLLHYLQATRGSQAVCDMSIIIGAKTYYVHSLILASLSSYFERREAESFREGRKVVLNLDTEIAHEYASCATDNIVGSVVDWVYNGHLDVNDTILANDVAAINRCLDHYLNCS